LWPPWMGLTPATQTYRSFEVVYGEEVLKIQQRHKNTT
jgi:hypothetical protein